MYIPGGLTTPGDTPNQLIREDNETKNKTWVWTYDNAGNILSRTEYAYTTGALGTALDTVLYSYGDSSWGDLLTSYDGISLSYDSIGNLLSDGTWTYSWEHGRELASMTKGSTTWTYTYDANGMRTKRTNGSTTYTYVYNGSQLTKMTVGNDVLYFTYDAQGYPVTVTMNGTVYYYITNLQGDVIAIWNESSGYVADYSYDAWGNSTYNFKNPNHTLDDLNPLRYRGYVWDSETGLYYLQSRYYNPAWGRFINADTFVSTGQGILGNNMFAYCNNNPVNMLDSTGELPWVAIIVGCVAVGAIVNNLRNAYYYETSDGESEIDSSSYQNKIPTRREKIDYTKQQTGDEHYGINAWRYYNEYTVHEHFWYLTSWAHGKNIPLFSEIAQHASVADVESHKWDYWVVNVLTVIWGILGL